MISTVITAAVTHWQLQTFALEAEDEDEEDEGGGGGLFGFIKNAANNYKEKQLRKEFKDMDRDGGGFVDISELSTYIIRVRKSLLMRNTPRL